MKSWACSAWPAARRSAATAAAACAAAAMAPAATAAGLAACWPSPIPTVMARCRRVRPSCASSMQARS
ncbi:hypothetical protein G6F23_015887 [Rhizopus arrhizus]|nr:hypothetical protein G6F23_015887 [Rhizopus arrhizus]